MRRILVADDEEGIRSFIAEALSNDETEVVQAADGEAAAALLQRRTFHLLITDLKMPRLGGLELLRRARTEQPDLEIIVLTAHGTVDGAVEAMKLGAFDYLQKPLRNLDELRLLVDRALERRRLRADRQRSAAQHTPDYLAVDPVSLRVLDDLDKVAATDATVLLLGDSGTGKEVAARRLHARSRRSEGPFVAVNCAAISDHLLESEMFGHEKGAFTGATAQRRGRFELADGGTLLLDEIGELKPELQAKLLRVLEERRFERLGSSRLIDVDVRVVAATNRDLEQMVVRGGFRADLYHRLAVFPIRLPRLRERPGDILPLSLKLLERIGRQLGHSELRLTDEAAQHLLDYAWPGNVRELANALERAAIVAAATVIETRHLALGASAALTASKDPAAATVFSGNLREVERSAILQALEANAGHRKRTAAQLGIGLRTLYEKIKEYGL